MRAAAGRRGRDSAPRRGGPRNPLSRKSSLLFLSLARSPSRSPPTRATVFSIYLCLACSFSARRLNSVLCPAPAFAPFALLRPFPFRHGNHPFGAPHESSPSPRCRLEYRNRSVGAKGYAGRKRGLARNTRRCRGTRGGRGRWRDWL